MNIIRINSIEEIEWEINALGHLQYVYVLPDTVLIFITLYNNGKADVTVTNANHSKEDFKEKSFGGNYELIEWHKEHLPHWVERTALYSC